MIKGTALGRAVLHDVALWATLKEKVRVPEIAREMTVGIIPKPGKDHTKVKGWRPIVLANTVGEKLIAEDVQDMEELWHERVFARTKGAGAMDSVMLMDRLRGKETGRNVHGRDIQSAFNSIDTKIMCNLIADEDTRRWIKDFLAPGSSQIKTNRVIGEARMTGGTPQGSPLSPSIFTVFVPAMVRRAEELDLELRAAGVSRWRARTRANQPKRSFERLQFIDDCNSVVDGSVKDMDKALGQAAEKFRSKLDHSKDWKNGVHWGVNLEKKRHQKFREEKANAAF